MYHNVRNSKGQFVKATTTSTSYNSSSGTGKYDEGNLVGTSVPNLNIYNNTDSTGGAYTSIIVDSSPSLDIDEITEAIEDLTLDIDAIWEQLEENKRCLEKLTTLMTLMVDDKK